jgi:rRNA processing protein Gar1
MVDDVVTIGYAANALGLTQAAIYLAIKEKRVESRVVLDRITIPRAELNRLKRKKAQRAKRFKGNGKK